MQIGIRLHDTKKGTLEERVAIAEEQGFSCAHLALKKVISEYSVADSALTPGFSCYLKNLFAAHHLDIAVLGCYLNLATPDQAVLEKNVHRYMAHIRMASLLGAGVVGSLQRAGDPGAGAAGVDGAAALANPPALVAGGGGASGADHSLLAGACGADAGHPPAGLCRGRRRL